MEKQQENGTRQIRKSAWALTAPDAEHCARAFTILETKLPTIPSDSDTSLHRYTHRFDNIFDVPDNRGLPLQKTLTLWLDHLSKAGLIRSKDVDEWRKKSDPEEARILLKEAGVDALRFKKHGAQDPNIVVVSDEKIRKIKKIHYTAVEGRPPSLQLLGRSSSIQALNPDGNLANLSAGGAAIQVACSKADINLTADPHIVALALAEFLGGEQSGAGIGGVFNSVTGKPVWISATYDDGNSADDIIFLDRSGARKRKDIVDQMNSGRFGNPDILFAKKGIPLGSKIHDPVRERAHALALELGRHLPPPEAISYLLNVSAPGAIATPERKAFAWARVAAGDRPSVREFSILDTDMPSGVRKNTTLVRYQHHFRNVVPVPDNDFLPLKDSLFIWLEHLASEGIIAPHKYLDWEVGGMSPRKAMTLLSEAKIDALQFVREETGTTHLVALDISKVEVNRSFNYQAQNDLSKPVENLSNSPTSILATRDLRAPFINLTAGGMAIQNACAKIESPFVEDQHATALALALFLGGEDKGAGIAAIINTQTAKPVWVSATMGDLFLDRFGARKKRDLLEQIQSGLFGPPAHLSARRGLALSDAIHRPVIMKAQVLVRELQAHMPPPEAVPILLNVSAPAILDERNCDLEIGLNNETPEMTCAPEP